MSRVASILNAGRAAAEGLMTDTCTVSRVTGQTLNESTGQYIDTVSTVYSGKCRFQIRAQAISAIPLVGDREVVALLAEVQVPMSAAAMNVGDTITCTASEFDPQLVGRVFRVRETFHKSHATARRTLVQEEQT